MANNLEISDEGYLINASVIAVLFIIGVTGQLICFAVLLEKFHRKRDLTPYFLNITTANSLMLLLNFPVNFASSVSHRYVLNQTGCYVLSFNAGTTGIVMITTLTFVAVTIYKQVTKKSANSHCATTSSGWRKGVAATWVYSAFLMLPPVFGWSSTALQTGQTSCAPDWRAKHPGDIIYLVLLSIFALLVPLGVSAMYFIKLYRFLARNQRENRSLSIKQRQSYEHYKNGAKMIGISMFVFFLVWTPYCAFGLTTAFSQEEVLHGTIALVPELIAKSSVIYNPIIYVLVNRRFRKSLLLMLPVSIRRYTQSRVETHQGAVGTPSDATTVRPGYDSRISSHLVPRSPLTGRSGRTSLHLPMTPFSFRPRVRSLTQRHNPSIRMLLWPTSFLGLKVLRAQMSDERANYTLTETDQHQSPNDEGETSKNSGADELATSL